MSRIGVAWELGWLLMQLACIVLYAIGTVLAFIDIRRVSHVVSVGV